MKLNIKTLEEGMDFIEDVIKQYDVRYDDYEEEVLLADFIVKNAINIVKIDIPDIVELEDKAFENDKDKVQGTYKYIAKVLLQREGFKESEIVFEKYYGALKPDIIAKSSTKSIIVECCSCKVSKIIEFLRTMDEIWVLTRGFASENGKEYLHNPPELFVFRRAKEWNRWISRYDKIVLEELQKVKSPL